jgi:hypothetical protein
VVENRMLMSSDRKRLIRCFGSESRIVVEKEVEVIGEYCFYRRLYLREIAFEPGSNLKELGKYAFQWASVGKLELPPKCEILTGMSLNGVESVTVSKENPFLRVEDSFLKSYDRKRLIWYMGSERQIVVKKEVEVIGEECFCGCSPRQVLFEKGSRLRRLGTQAFWRSCLARIRIPASVRVIEERCFDGCWRLYEVVYEGRVPEIGENAFNGCHALNTVLQ